MTVVPSSPVAEVVRLWRLTKTPKLSRTNLRSVPRLRPQSASRRTDIDAYSVAVTSPWGGPRAVAAALGVVGPTTRPPRPLPDPLRVGGEADIVRTPVVLNPGLLGNQKRQSQSGRGRASGEGEGEADVGVALQVTATHPLPAATASDLPRCAGEVTERNGLDHNFGRCWQ